MLHNWLAAASEPEFDEMHTTFNQILPIAASGELEKLPWLQDTDAESDTNKNLLRYKNAIQKADIRKDVAEALLPFLSEMPAESQLMQKLLDDITKMKGLAAVVITNVAAITLASHLAMKKRSKDWVSDGKKMLKFMEDKLKVRQTDLPLTFMNRFNDSMHEKKVVEESAISDVPRVLDKKVADEKGADKKALDEKIMPATKKRKLAGSRTKDS